MKTYKEIYGSDIDGNREVTQYKYELEESDRDEIVERLLKILNGYDESDYPIAVVVEIDGVEFEVDVEDYL